MKYLLLLLFFTCIALDNGLYAQYMDNSKITKILKEKTGKVHGKKGNWMLEYKNVVLFIITDEQANRMRIYAPIIESNLIKKIDLIKLLEANFHSALDAKYALAGGFVVSIYNHPLQELDINQLSNAIDQVANLVLTYGTSYNSTGLVFPGGETKNVKEKSTKM